MNKKKKVGEIKAKTRGVHEEILNAQNYFAIFSCLSFDEVLYERMLSF